MRDAPEVDKHSAPELVAVVSELARRKGVGTALRIGTLELCDDSYGTRSASDIFF
jgi:hypothetical protein